MAPIVSTRDNSAAANINTFRNTDGGIGRRGAMDERSNQSEEDGDYEPSSDEADSEEEEEAEATATGVRDKRPVAGKQRGGSAAGDYGTFGALVDAAAGELYSEDEEEGVEVGNGCGGQAANDHYAAALLAEADALGLPFQGPPKRAKHSPVDVSSGDVSTRKLLYQVLGVQQRILKAVTDIALYIGQGVVHEGSTPSRGLVHPDTLAEHLFPYVKKVFQEKIYITDGDNDALKTTCRGFLKAQCSDKFPPDTWGSWQKTHAALGNAADAVLTKAKNYLKRLRSGQSAAVRETVKTVKGDLFGGLLKVVSYDVMADKVEEAQALAQGYSFAHEAEGSYNSDLLLACIKAYHIALHESKGRGVARPADIDLHKVQLHTVELAFILHEVQRALLGLDKNTGGVASATKGGEMAKTFKTEVLPALRACAKFKGEVLAKTLQFTLLD